MAGEYRALTRKYRPIHFSDIVSQEHISNTLANAIEQNRLAHAYMFCGPRGVGKTTMARVLARTINQIDANVDGEALNNTLNIIEIDAASNNKVEDIHRIRETVRIPPQSGKYKIYIVDEVHMLTKSAFNALLKTLEEPPPYVIFIFATTEPHKVLPTILSRVQRFDFRRIKVAEIVSRLQKIAQDESISIDNESLHVIAQKADGALRDALSLMDQAIAFCGTQITYQELLKALNVVGVNRLFELTDYMIQQDASAAMQLVDDLMQEGHDIQEFLVGMSEHLRNLFFAKDSKNLTLIEASDETKKKLAESAQSFHGDDLLRLLHICSEGQLKIKNAQQPRVFFELTILKLVKMERIDGLQELLKELRELSKGVKEGSPQTNNPVSASYSDSAARAPQVNQDSLADAYRAKMRQNLSNPSEKGTQASYLRPKSNLKSVTLETPQNDEIGTVQIEGATALKLIVQAKNEAPEEEIASEKKELSLHDITQQWSAFKTAAKATIDATICLILERTRPIDLNLNTVLLEVSDEFTENVIMQAKRELSMVLSKVINCKVQIDCRLTTTVKAQESLDPYERFRRLQEKDPILRSVVELFGAELDYNI